MQLGPCQNRFVLDALVELWEQYLNGLGSRFVSTTTRAQFDVQEVKGSSDGFSCKL